MMLGYNPPDVMPALQVMNHNYNQGMKQAPAMAEQAA